MKIKRIKFLLSLGASCAAALVAATAFGQTVVVDDNFAADGSTSTDAQYFYSTSSNGIEFNADSLGLVSGSSGRQIHGIFPAVTLSEVDDSITVSFTFTTPATVGTNNASTGEDNAFRMGLFNTLGRETIAMTDNPDFDPDDPNSPAEIPLVIDGVTQTEGFLGNTLASSNPDTGPGPNDLYGNSPNSDTPGTISGLPGFSTAYDSMDIADGLPDDESQIRQSNIDFGTGRMMATTSGFTLLESLDAVDPGNGFPVATFAPSTSYSGSFTITRVSATEVSVTSMLDVPGYPEPIVTDPIPMVNAPAGEEFTFDYVGFAASSGAFGSTNDPSDDDNIVVDNGLDFTSIQIETTGDVELPDTILGDFTGDGIVDCADLDGYINNLGMAAIGDLDALDFDRNGTLELSDANSVIGTLVVAGGVTGTFPGDLNCDGRVDVLGDAFALVANLNTDVTSYAQGDMNFDGTVSVLGDAFILVANLGNTNQ